MSHKEEGRGDAERRRQMKRAGRRSRARRGEEEGGRKTLSERERRGEKLKAREEMGPRLGRTVETANLGGDEGSGAAGEAS